MARPMVFRPAGFDSDSDDEGYLLGDGGDYVGEGDFWEKSHQGDDEFAESEIATAENVQSKPLPPGGFGVPENYKSKYSGGAPPGLKSVSGSTYPTTNGTSHRPKTEKRTYLHTKKVKEGDKNVQLEDFRSAVIQGNLSQLEKYIDFGLSVNEVLRSGWTALMYAAISANSKAVSFLLERKANANFQKDHFTVLMAACSSTSRDEEQVLSCVKLLIGKGASVKDFDRYHMTPLLYAARENKPSVIRLLIEKGANKDKQDSRGYTALIWAACKGNLQAVQALLEARVDTSKACMEGFTAQDHAELTEHENIAKILKTYSTSANIDTVMPELANLAAKEKDTPEDESLGVKVSATHYGELELFLIGIELGDLIPKFQENKVSFENFLRYTDDDFRRMGISQIGVRKKLLDTIKETHKKEWTHTSLPSILYNKHLTCPESTAIIANMSKHAIFMASTAGYICDQIKVHPDILHKAKNKQSVKDLTEITDEAIAKVGVLSAELQSLRRDIAKEITLGDFNAPDVIETPKKYSRKKKRTYRRPLLLVVSVSLVGLALWKRDFLLEAAKELLSSQTEV